MADHLYRTEYRGEKGKTCQDGMFQGIAISLIYTAFISAVLYLNADKILRIFSRIYGYRLRAHHHSHLLPFYWSYDPES
ncbi:hypothetical protein [Hungatella sp.]|uniref:hypothetical protein n=1 Tax=Hungatella sp. TaxID=2613924 RepID=UPI0039A3E8D2